MRSVFLFFCLISFSAQGQTGNNWAEGLVFLENGDTLHGNVSLNRRQGLLMVYQSNSTTKTFSARQVAGFFLSEQGRAFGTFPYKEEGRPLIPAFFEIITVGRCLSLLARELDLKTDAPIPAGQDATSFYSPVKNTKQELYFMDHEGIVRKVPSKKKGLLAILPNPGLLETWLKGHKLNTGRTEQVKEMVEFYNLNVNKCEGNVKN